MRHALTLIFIAITAAFNCGCENAKRSMVFFTGTTLGVEIAFEPNSTAPARFIVGYKRAEGLMDPIMEDRGGSNTGYTVKDNPHSVLAKIAGELKSGTGSASPSLQGAQWFASGEAAEILARHPATAAVLTNDPDIAKEAARTQMYGANLEGVNAKIASMFLGNIELALVSLAETDSSAKKHVDALKSFASKHLPMAIYAEYKWDPSSLTLTQIDIPVHESDIQNLIQYQSVVDKTIPRLEAAIASLKANKPITLCKKDDRSNLYDTVSVTPNSDQQMMLEDTLARFRSYSDSLHAAISTSTEIYDAVEFYSDKLMNR